MQKQLTELVEKIEKADLSDKDRAEIYAAISNALQSTVWPVLVKHMPEDRLSQFTDNPALMTEDEYAKILADTVSQRDVATDIQSAMTTVVENITDLLKTDFGIG